jgi:pentatricopeptide repeat protein
MYRCSRAGFPQGASEIFTLMQHMGCEPDRASYNILVDAYVRAGRHRGKLIKPIPASVPCSALLLRDAETERHC